MAFHNNKIVFTDEGLPGESVEIKTLKEKNNYTEAETIKVVTASTKRTTPHCNHYKICSLYQYIDYNEQLAIKEKQIKEIFRRSLSIELNEFKINPSAKIWGYRNKLRLNVLWDKTAHLAYHYPQTHNKFIKIDECFLASKEINNLFGSLLELINKHNLTSIEEAKIKQTASGQEMLLVLFGKKPESYETLLESLLSLKANFPLAGVVYVENNKSDEIILDGKNYLEEKLNNKTLRIGAQSFFQINVDMLKVLLADMRTKLRNLEYETIADLYCGIGTFGILLGDNAKKIISLESSSQNTVFLKENLKLNKVVNTKIFEGYSEELISEVLKEKIDILLIDPPRKGIGDTMCKNIIANPVKYIFYVSCNPSTLARDLKILLKKYNLDAAYGYDFFPHTPHIETLSVLTRK